MERLRCWLPWLISIAHHLASRPTIGRDKVGGDWPRVSRWPSVSRPRRRPAKEARGSGHQSWANGGPGVIRGVRANRGEPAEGDM